MRPRLAWLTGLLLLSIVIVAACGRRPFAEGSSRELTIVTTLPETAPEILLLRAIVERTAVRIEDEKAYVVRIVRPEQKDAYRARNVLVVGYGADGDVPAPARGLRRRIPNDGPPFAFTPDLWLRGQAAGIVWTKTRDAWLPAVSKHQNPLFQALDRATFAGVRERVLSLPRDADIESRLSTELGVRMTVPRGMSLTLDRPARAALLFEAGPPTRLIRLAVMPETTPISDPYHARDALARRFRPNEVTLDVAEPQLSRYMMPGVVRQLHGRWRDTGVSAAGPYRYYEIARGRLRVQVDLAVFAPGKAKLPYLRELHAMAETIAPSQ